VDFKGEKQQVAV